MHASIAIFVMMFGGPVLPEPVITTVPLNNDLSNPTSMQELEWQERVKLHPLPQIPTLGDSQKSADNGRSPPRYPYPPTQVPAKQNVMPVPPTQSDAAASREHALSA